MKTRQSKSNLVTEMTVKKVVYSWSIRFGEKALAPQQLDFLAGEYHEDLIDEYVSEAEFVFAAKAVRKRCQFFPKMKEILDAVREYRQRPPQSSRLQIGYKHDRNLTPEELQRNLKRIELCSQAAAKKITWEECTQQMEQIYQEAFTITDKAA